jgi:uncharacterized protein YecE (DUF72 family)
VNAANIEIGCQGWTCPDWITPAAGDFVFYPRGTRSGQMLETYAKIFSSIEVDSTFYAIPPVSTIENWYLKTPETFTFSLKMPQEITHELRLGEASYIVSEAFCERTRELKEKLAIVLIQLPPQFAGSRANAKNLRNFLAQLPKDIRFAVEFRNRDWMIDWTFAELEKNNVALCLCEGSWVAREMTFDAARKSILDFSYIRFMGERDLPKFDKIYRNEDANLRIWAEEIENLNAQNVFVYFSNFYEGLAPASANKLKKLLEQEIIKPEVLENQVSLF